MLSRKGFVFDINTVPSDVLEKIKKELTVIPTFNIEYGQFPNPIKCYIENRTKTRMAIPRFYAPKYFETPVEDWGNIEKRPNMVFKGTLNTSLDQDIAVDAVMKQLQSTGGGILCAGCGRGKTIMAINTACQLQVKTIILVHKEFLMDQWKERIQTFVPQATVGKIQGGVVDVKDKDFVIGMMQSICTKEYDPAVFDGFGLVTVDECFPYKQTIVTELGPMKIGTLYNIWKRGGVLPKVLSFNETLKLTEMKDITYAWQKNNESLLKISFSKSNIECTEHHRILTPTGYVEACDLSIGSLLQCNYECGMEESMVARAFNEDQYQIMLGSFLGDGCVHTLPSGRYRMKIIHCEAQKEYCEWKATMFGCQVSRIENNGYASGIAYRFTTKVFDLPVEKTVPKTKTTCPQWILDELDFRGLAIWWMDDGNLQNMSGIISTCSFDEESHQRIVQKLGSMGIEACYRSDGKGYLSIYINKVGLYQLLRGISIYMHANMQYKFTNPRIENSVQEYFYGDLVTVYTRFNNISPRVLSDGMNNIFTVLWGNKSFQYLYRHCEVCECCSFHFKYRKMWACTSHGKKMIITDRSPLEPPIVLQKYEWDTQFLLYGTVKVTSIQRIKNEGDQNRVFDIEVADNHNFICCSGSGIGPIVHNCHHACAKVFSKSLYTVNCKYVLGLSATPERKDGLTKVLYWLLGDICYRSERTESKEAHVQTIYYDHPSYRYPPPENKLGKIAMATVTTLVSELPERNDMIVQLVHTYMKQKRKILILSDRRDQCFTLQRSLGDAHAAVYIGGMKQEHLKAAESAQVLVSTYSMTKEGFDLPSLDTVIFATSQSDVNQSSGRILRETVGKVNNPLIVDIVDRWCIFFAQYKKRCAFYKKSGFTMLRGNGGAVESEKTEKRGCLIEED